MSSSALPIHGGGARTLLSSYVQYAVSCPDELKPLLPEQPSSSLFDIKFTRQIDAREIVPAAAIPVYPALPDRAFRAFITRRVGASPPGAARRGSADRGGGGEEAGAAAAAERALAAQLENFDFRDIPHLTSAERAFLDGLDTPLFVRFQREVTDAFHAAAKAEVAKARAAERRITSSGLFDREVTNTRVHALVAVDVVPRRGVANLHAVAHRVLRRFMAAVRRGTLAADSGALDDDFLDDVAPPEVPGAGARRRSGGVRRRSSAAGASAAELAAAAAAATGISEPPPPSHQSPSPSPSALSLAARDINGGGGVRTMPPAAVAPPADDALLRSAHALHVWKAQAGRALEDGPGMRRIWAAERGIHPTAASLQHAVRAAAASVSTLVPAAAAAGRGAAIAGAVQHHPSPPPTSFQQRRAELYADYGAHSGAGGGGAEATASSTWDAPTFQFDSPAARPSPPTPLSPPVLSIAAMQARLQGASLTEQSKRRRAAREAVNAAALGFALTPQASAPAGSSALVRRRRSSGSNARAAAAATIHGGRAASEVPSPLVIEHGIVRLPAAFISPAGGVPPLHASATSGGGEASGRPVEPASTSSALSAWSTEGLSLTAAVSAASGANARPSSPGSDHPSQRPRSPTSSRGPLLLRPLSRTGSTLSLLRGGVASSRHTASVAGGSLPRVDSAVLSRLRGGGAQRRGGPGSVASAESAPAFARATPAFHRPEVLDAVAALSASPAAGGGRAAASSKPGRERADSLRQLRASASSAQLLPLSEASMAAADASLGLVSREAAESVQGPAGGLRGSIASLRRSVEASLRLEAPIADRIVALGVTNGARIGPLASPLRPVRVPKVVSLPRRAPSHGSGTQRPDTADSAADTATVSAASVRPGTSATTTGPAHHRETERGDALVTVDSAEAASLGGLLNTARSAENADGPGAPEASEARAVADPAAAASGALTQQLLHIMDLLEMPARERAGFVARYSGSRARAGGLRDACALWEVTAQGVVHAEVLKHALAHVYNAREALALALRIAKQDAPSEEEGAEEPVVWVPVIPEATLRFAVAQGALAPNDAVWAEEQLSITSADELSAYFLWSLPVRSVPAGDKSLTTPDPAAAGAAASNTEPDLDEEESVAAVAAAAIVEGRAPFPPPPIHGPRIAFRPVFRSGAGGSSLTAATLAALADARDGGGDAGRRGSGSSPTSSFHLRLRAQEPSVAELAASEARIGAIFESFGAWLSDACLRITGTYGDAVAFRGVNVLAALRREARAGLIPDRDLSSALREDAAGGEDG